MRNFFILLAFITCLVLPAAAQTSHQNSGWLFLMNSTKINEKWGVHFDFQLRSQDDWTGVKNILIRPGVTYFLGKHDDLTLGYLFTNTYNNLQGTAGNVLTEHRVWQQYVHKHKLKNIAVSHRFRLEQRFIEGMENKDFFAQRLRYFARFLLPLQKGVKEFEEGVFIAVQNEFFLNIQNKDKLNGHLFDQNRAYGAVGYRFSKMLDLEAGYMNQAQKGATRNTLNNIVQVAVYTRF